MFRLKRSSAVVAAVACCLVAPTGVATGGTRTEPDPAARIESSSLDTTATRAVGAGDRRPATYGGTWIDRDEGVVNVAVTGSDAALAAVAGSSEIVRLVRVRHSWVELGALRDRVLRDAPALRKAGIDLRAMYPKASTNRVVLEARI